jgi:hypothetical protein
MAYRPLPTLCIRGCGRPRRIGQRLCIECHAEAMRAYRNKHAHELAGLIAEFARMTVELERLLKENEQLRQGAALSPERKT